MKRFGEVFKSGQSFEGVKGRKVVAELLNKDIVICDVSERPSQLGNDYFIIVKAALYEKQDELFTFTTGGKVLRDKILAAKEKGLLPLVGCITRKKSKNGQYYMDIE